MLTKWRPIFVRRGYSPCYLRKLIFCYSNFAHDIISNSHNRENDFSKTQNTEQSIEFWNSQITKFGRTGNIKEAESIFVQIPVKNTITWTALLTAYSENGQLANARKMFDEMPQRNIVSWNAMIAGYVRNGLRINEAYELFCRMPGRNGVSYAAMITGFARAAMLKEAERLYNDMENNWRDPVCANALIDGYLKAAKFDEAVRIFEGMIEKDVVTWSSMIDGYCKKRMINEARRLFEIMPVKNVVSWTVMINGYMKTEKFKDGFLLFSLMRQEGIVKVNSTTLTIVMEACANFVKYGEGCQLHGLVSRMGFEYDVILSNSIINMYGKLGFIQDAHRLFRISGKKDTVTWNSLIAAYVQADKFEEAYGLFQIMPKRDNVSWTTIIGGFFGQGDVAKSIHLFNLMPQKDDVAWTTIISGLVNNGKFTEAIHCYIRMIRRAFRPNVLTLSSVTSAAAGLVNLIVGLQLHAHVVKMHMYFDLSAQNSLVAMYSKCGSISDAYCVFMDISSPNVISFNSIIVGFAYHGLGRVSLDLFDRMQIEGQEPNGITFLGALSACTHIGLVEEGQNYFKLMKSKYHIEPEADHYACMIDLLGRAGLLDQAVCMVNSMPFEPNAGVWGALLSASYSNLRPDIAKLAAEQLMRLEPDNATPGVVLSNLYSNVGIKDGELVRSIQKSKGIRKSVGCSWILARENSV